MQEYIIAKKEFEEAEHIILKISKELGVSVIKMEDLEGQSYNIALIKFVDLGDQYDLLDGTNFITREASKAKKFIEGLIRTQA